MLEKMGAAKEVKNLRGVAKDVSEGKKKANWDERGGKKVRKEEDVLLRELGVI